MAVVLLLVAVLVGTSVAAPSNNKDLFEVLERNLARMQAKCPIKGQVFQGCRTCPATCDNPGLICTLQCIPGCGCPSGMLIDETKNKCVPMSKCKKTKCPIKKQVFQQCRTCPATCDNPGLICTLQCIPGCGCPSGMLIDETKNKCVPMSKCKNSLSTFGH